MAKVAVLLAILFSLSACAGFTAFEPVPLQQNPIASPRSPESSISLKTSEYRGYDLAYLDASIGRSIGILRWNPDKVIGWGPSWELGIEAGSWFVLGWTGGDSFLLLTQDFLFAIPVTMKWKWFTFSVKFNHISAHLGDGMSTLREEELEGSKKETFEFFDEVAEENDMDLQLCKPIVYSRDFFSGHISIEQEWPDFKVKSYGHTGYLHKVLPEDMGRWFAGGGTEFQLRLNSSIRPYSAVDVTWNQDSSSTDVSLQTGLEFQLGTDHRMRAAFTLFKGKDRRGQLYGRELEEIGIGISIR